MADSPAPPAPEVVDITLMATGCSCRCRHCYASATRRVRHPIDVEAAEAILDDFAPLLRAAREPLVDVYYDLFDHPDAPGMIRMLHRRGLYGYFRDVATNGVGLARRPEYRQFLWEMKATGSEWLQLTFHGTAETHDGFVRRRGAFHELLAAARAGLDAGLRLNLFVHASKRNIDELPALADLLRREGLVTRPDVPFGICCWSPIGYGAEIEHLRPDPEDYARLRQHFQRGFVPGFRPEQQWRELALNGDHAGFQCGSPGTLSIEAHGNLDVTVGWGSQDLGNVHRDPLDAVVRAWARHKASDPRHLIHQEIARDGESTRLKRLAELFGDPNGTGMHRQPGALALWLHRMDRAQREGAPPAMGGNTWT